MRVGPRLLILGTNGASSDEGPSTFVQFRPPELPLDKLACSGSSRVSRREGSMRPLQNLRTQTVRDNEAPRRAITWSWLLQLGPLDSRLSIPLDGGHYPGSGENGFWNGLPLLWLKLSRECIWFEILGTWAIRKSEVKSVKKRAQRACRDFNLFASQMQVMLLWSVHMRKGCLAPSNQCLHSSNAILLASSSLFPLS